MEFRRYKPEDLAAMFALDEVCFEVPFRFSREMMRRMASAKHAIVQLAFAEGSPGIPDHLLGFCIAHLERTKAGLCGYVVTLDVDPAARRQGVAAALVEKTERILTEMGAETMRLHVYAGNAVAIRLYERLGYTRLRRGGEFYGPGLHALVYRKALGAETTGLPSLVT